MAPKNPTRGAKGKKSITKPITSIKRKRTNPIPPTNVNRFISEEARERFEKSWSFEVVGERRFDVVDLTKYPILETMIRERGWEELNNMVHDSNNKSVIMEFYTNACFSGTKYKAYIQGKTVDYSPDAINQLIGLTPPEECEVEKLQKEVHNMIGSEWDALIVQMCRPRATRKSARMLTYAHFLPIPKAWASFVIQTLESTSCTSDIPLKRVFTVSDILDQKPINVGQLIANSIHSIATGRKTVLGHESLINWLCEKQLVSGFEGDLYTPTVKPITDKTIDVFMKKFAEFMRLRGEGDEAMAPPPQQPPQMAPGENSQQGTYPPITRSYVRFDNSHERMNEYFSHQERYAANMKREIADDFDAGERRAGDNFFEGLQEEGNPSTWNEEDEMRDN